MWSVLSIIGAATAQPVCFDGTGPVGDDAETTRVCFVVMAETAVVCIADIYVDAGDETFLIIIEGVRVIAGMIYLKTNP